ncbi:hypothetical protein ACIOWI_36915 [Streptomyces sp. NPDC087659]|uniref:hypothetical protein n=1 Tax=Streptomyces sp. NPDC087659 TaxID=3365801 RepID=UPI0038202F4E
MRSAEDGGSLETAAAVVMAAQQALQTARRDLAAAIVAARRAGELVQRIAARTGLDPVTVRNILSVTPTRSPDGRRT